MFYAGWIAPGWGGSTQGSRLGRLSEVLKAGGDEEPQAYAAQEDVAGLHLPDPSEHLAHVAAAERQLDYDAHDLLPCEAVGRVVSVERLDHDAQPRGESG